VRERSQNVTETVTSELIEASHATDGSLYGLWRSGELEDLLEIPDGARVEIIGGKFVVSPVPVVPHAGIIHDISKVFTRASLQDPEFLWESLQVVNLGLETAQQSYIPDLLIVPTDLFEAARETEAHGFMPDEAELAVEVTSPGGAGRDRPPTAHYRRAGKKRQTKWTGYATIEIPYYLLVDRSPEVARTTLFSIPHRGTGAYLHQESWEFGETIHLPEPFDVEIDTARWKPWKR
jgi:Uma2 family endonuclease